jgi:hypothetical protein
MAYADIPINMRPALTELTAGGMQPGFSAVAAAAAGMGQISSAAAGALAYSQQLMALHGSQGGKEGAEDGAGGVAGGIKATQVELVRGALLGCLKMLRQMSEALGEVMASQHPETLWIERATCKQVYGCLLLPLMLLAACMLNSSGVALYVCCALLLCMQCS